MITDEELDAMVKDFELDILDGWAKVPTPTMTVLDGIVPRLVAEVRRLREENERLQGKIRVLSFANPAEPVIWP
jgi:hypothetical protein